jgi:serine/threonine protein kinase
MDAEEDVVIEVEPLARRAAPERFGKYRNLRRIGQGGMADVFLAGWRGPAGFDKLVVVKRLRDEVASDASFREMFLDEARLAARLNHPNVVQTYEVFEDEGSQYITMEYLEGQPLSRLVRECAKVGTRLEAPMCARIVSDALCGLHYAHEACDYHGVPLQIVHRDVSPQNVFVTYDGQIKVVDFGIAKAELGSTKTQVGFFKGKAAYMAPEQLEGGPIDRRVDVFTTGIVLWELLVGKKLMAAESTAKTLVRLLKDPVPRVSDLVPDMDPKLDAIVARALERDPAARFQTASDMRNALEQYLIDGHFSVRSEEVGHIVAELFRDSRDDLRRQVSEQMARASQYPRSGPISIGNMAGTSISGLNQAASMSGISVANTARSMFAAPVGTGTLVAERPRGLRTQSILVGAVVAVSVAIVFALVERTRNAPSVGEPPPPTAAVALPMVTPPTPIAAPPPPVDAITADPPARADPLPPAARTVQAMPARRSGRPQWEPRPVTSLQRSTAPSALTPQASAPPSPAAEAAPPPVAPPTPATSPQTPSASPAPTTQEGRKFRLSL